MLVAFFWPVQEDYIESHPPPPPPLRILGDINFWPSELVEGAVESG